MWNLSSFAAGGLVAAALALWGQIRSFLGWVSSFVVVTATLDPEISAAVRYLLYVRYRAGPSGEIHYVSRSVYLTRQSKEMTVPFRFPAMAGLYFGKRHVLFISGALSGTMTIRGLRGWVDFNQLIGQAVRAHDEYRIEQTEHRDRTVSNFSVYSIMGREKGFAALGLATSKDDPDPSGRVGSQNLNAPGSATPISPMPYHHSFLYKREEYTESGTTNPFQTLYFDREIEKVVGDARKWFGLRSWYAARSIPWRRGAALVGPPGSGKSSLAVAIAQALGIRLYHFHLSTLSDSEFIREIRNLATPCVLLFEDFDAIFHGRENVTEHKSLSFDTVLNSISGVDSRSGVYLVLTTNHLEFIDPAMGVLEGGESTRAGRIDSVVHVGYMTVANQRRMAEHMLRDWPDAIEHVLQQAKDQLVTPATMQERCIQIAFALLGDGKASEGFMDPAEAKIALRSRPDVMLDEADDTGDACDDNHANQAKLVRASRRAPDRSIGQELVKRSR